MLMLLCAAAAAALGKYIRPNILIFLLDDVGYGDFGFMGHSVARTPNIDAFSRTATRLTTLYAGAPICSPSRAALLSGRYADSVGVWELVTPGSSEQHLQPDALILGNVLAQAGYACAQLGKWHVSPKDAEVGLSAYGFEVLKKGNDTATNQAPIAIEWISAQANASRPWLLYHDVHECHEPLTHRSPLKYRQKVGPPNQPPREFHPHCELTQQLPTRQPTGVCSWRVESQRGSPDCHRPSCGDECSPDCRRPIVSGQQLSAVRRKAWGIQRTYLGCMAQVDDAFGRLMRFLESPPTASARAISENTLILLSSDNGPAGPLPQKDFFGSARPFRGWKGRCAQPASPACSPACPARALAVLLRARLAGRSESARAPALCFARLATPTCARPHLTAAHQIPNGCARRGSVFEGGIRVPGLVRWPAGGVGRFAREEVSEPLHFVDILPTLAEAAGAQLSQAEAAQLHGVSFLSLLRTGPRRPPSEAQRSEQLVRAGGGEPTAPAASALPASLSSFGERSALARPFPLFWTIHMLPGHGLRDDRCMICDNARYAMRIGRWKIIAWAEPYGCASEPMDFVVGAKLLETDVHLYDLLADPEESEDRARAEPELAGRMLQELERTRAAVQGLGQRWDLSCLMPVGRPGAPISFKPAQRGYCKCAHRNKTAPTIAERAELAGQAARLLRAPRPLLILSPSPLLPRALEEELQASPLIVRVEGAPFGTPPRPTALRPLSARAAAAASAQQFPSVPSAPRARGGAALFAGGPLCAFEFPAQLGPRANATLRARQAVLALMQVGASLASRALGDPEGPTPPALRGPPAKRVAVWASPEQLLGPLGNGGRCSRARGAQQPRGIWPHWIASHAHSHAVHGRKAMAASDGEAAAAQLASGRAGAAARAPSLALALAAADAIVIQLVHRDRQAHWRKLTKGARIAGSARRLQQSERTSGAIAPHRHGTYLRGRQHRDNLTFAAAHGSATREGDKGARRLLSVFFPDEASERASGSLLAGESVHRRLEFELRAGITVRRTFAEYRAAADAEDVAAAALLRAAGLKVHTLAVEDLNEDGMRASELSCTLLRDVVELPCAAPKHNTGGGERLH